MKPVSFLQTLLAATFCVAACGNHYRGEKPNSEATLAVLTEEFESYALDEEAFKPRDVRFLPEALLPRIDLDLTENGRVTRWIKKDRWLLEIRELPEPLIVRLRRKLHSGNGLPGFAILTVGFWEEIQALKAKGLRVAITRGDETWLNGIYYSDNKIIGADVFSNPGTLTHEYRHHLQHEAVQGHGTPQPVAIPTNCFSEVNRYFGELDATTAQLPLWEGAFNGWDLMPASHREAKVFIGPEKWPLGFALETNLQYPINAAKEVTESRCPKDLVSAISEANTFLEKSNGAVLAAAQGVRAVRVDHRVWWNRIRDCADDNCRAKFRERIDQIPARITKVRTAFNESVRVATRDRAKTLREVLAKVPKGTHEELCRWSGGYARLLDCAIPVPVQNQKLHPSLMEKS